MKNIRQILFLGCILLNTSSNMLNAMEYDVTIARITNILKTQNNPNRTFEAIADYLLKTTTLSDYGFPGDFKLPSLKDGLLLYKEHIDIATKTLKNAPVEIRKAFYKSACGAQVAVAKMKQEYLDNIKAHKAIIADYDKKTKQLATLNKKVKKTEKEAKIEFDLGYELESKRAAYENSVENLKAIEEEYAEKDFNTMEQWISKVKSIAYWNSGSGFFEQFWNLNWSGKALTFVGTPLACLGACKLYNDYLSAQDEDIIQDVKDTVQDVKNKIELAKVVVQQKLR